MRYKRYKRYGRRRSTNIIRMKFQSFMDINTSSSSMQIITISAGGKEIMRRLAPQFNAYKYYKIGKISVKLVPASTLPVDPTGLSYEAGENTVDPRDQLTPGLMRITNGEDIFEDLTGLTDDQMYGIYNNMLLDPRWYKWMLQSGVKRHAYPRYWQIGQLHQDKWPGATINVPHWSGNPASGGAPAPNDTGNMSIYTYGSAGTGYSTAPPYEFNTTESSALGLFQTGHRGVLGWLPTDSLDRGQPFLASPPEVEVMKIIFPKARKTSYYYRAFITEEVLFREPIVNFGITAGDDKEYRPLDVFHSPTGVPWLPSSGFTDIQPTDARTGGNYGND